MKWFLLIFSVCVIVQAQGQILKSISDKAKQKTINKTNEKVDKTIDKSLDSASTKKEKPKQETENKTTDSANTGNAPRSAADTVKDPAAFKAYSKFDFVPGEKVIGFEDFSTGSIGDFPAGWNTSGSAEIVTVDNHPGRWLWISRAGVFLPEFTEKYPDDFTFEFDLLHGIPFGSNPFHFVMAEMNEIGVTAAWYSSPHIFKLGLNITNSGQREGTVSIELKKNSVSEVSNQVYTELMSDKFNPVHVSVWKQKERVRVYVNQEKIWDIPKAIAPGAKLNSIFFPILDADANNQHYIGNLRLAVGAPDARNKFLTQNKWVTHGILFDVNSANIKPESYGTLKEMANILKENPDLKVKIVGHTDADGADASNLDLSKRRAASVKAIMAKEFGIDESRMETDGKGESEPIDKKDTPAGKANNRRVEFIKR